MLFWFRWRQIIKIGSLHIFCTATDTERVGVEYYSQVNYCKYGEGVKYVGVV
jgi:hypothetical protein